jgi:uncharacterized damage-inducible protein DinB
MTLKLRLNSFWKIKQRIKQMKLTEQIANQFREVYLNGDWISTNLKTQLTDVDLKMATTKVGDLNTIAALTFHLNYYVEGVLNVLEGGTLDIRDKYSYDVPPIESEEDWNALKQKSFKDAERFAVLIEQMPEDKLREEFVEEKYGNYHRNLIGMNEHCYYHLGQVVIIKKMIKTENTAISNP